MKKWIKMSDRQIFKDVQKYYLSSQKNQEYSDYLIVPYAYAENKDLTYQTLYYVFIQGYFKQIPIIILKDSINKQIQQQLESDFKDEITHDKFDNLVILPDSQVLHDKVFDQELSNNQNIVIQDKSKEHFYPVICDRQNEMEINALHQAQIFLDDPTWVSIISDETDRLYGQKEHCMNIQIGTYQYGLNFLFVSNLNLLKSKCCLLACPPGLTHGHTGSILRMAKLLITRLGLKNLSVLTALDELHTNSCQQLANHFYVGYIGAVVGENSNGCGSGMFRIIHSISNQSHANVYLENSKTYNIEFYKKMGLILDKRYDFINKFGYKSHVFTMYSPLDKECRILRSDEIDQKNWEEMEIEKLFVLK